ncbi:MAG: hypothetical protein RBR00_12665 [Gudongella oleilytica]|nr:hypothetical protein [Gudongella oleilytica]
MMTMFVRVLERSKNKDEGQIEAISIIKNGFDGVKEENLIPLLDWLNH